MRTKLNKVRANIIRPLRNPLPVILLIGAIGVQTITSCSSDDIDDILGGSSSSSGGGKSSSSIPSSSSRYSSSGGSSSSGIDWLTCHQVQELYEQCTDITVYEVEKAVCEAEAAWAADQNGDDYYSTLHCDEAFNSRKAQCTASLACTGANATNVCREHYEAMECFSENGGDQGDYCHIEYENDDGGYYKGCLLIGEAAVIYSAAVCLNVRGGEVKTYSQCRASGASIDNTIDSGDMGSYCHYKNDCDLIGGKYTYSEEHCLDAQDGEVITYSQCKNKGAKIYNEIGEGEWD